VRGNVSAITRHYPQPKKYLVKVDSQDLFLTARSNLLVLLSLGGFSIMRRLPKSL